MSESGVDCHLFGLHCDPIGCAVHSQHSNTVRRRAVMYVRQSGRGRNLVSAFKRRFADNKLQGGQTLKSGPELPGGTFAPDFSGFSGLEEAVGGGDGKDGPQARVKGCSSGSWMSEPINARRKEC